MKKSLFDKMVERRSNMTCPRCGTKMEGGVCPECGFPVTKYVRKRNRKHLILFVV